MYQSLHTECKFQQQEHCALAHKCVPPQCSPHAWASKEKKFIRNLHASEACTLWKNDRGGQRNVQQISFKIRTPCKITIAALQGYGNCLVTPPVYIQNTVRSTTVARAKPKNANLQFRSHNSYIMTLSELPREGEAETREVLFI